MLRLIMSWGLFFPLNFLAEHGRLPQKTPCDPPVLMRNLLAKAISAYQILISPFYSPCCRFYPTCSEYARQAVLVHGVMKGSCLALWRIVRCHPFCHGGVDLVPPLRRKSNNKSDTSGEHILHG